MHLLDTNIFLEVLLNRETDLSFFITDFSLYSIGIFLMRSKLAGYYNSFLDDLDERDIQIVALSPEDLRRIPTICTQYNLDFDDAYQYVAADANNLKLVSLDHDFDRVPSGRVHPKDI